MIISETISKELRKVFLDDYLQSARAVDRDFPGFHEKKRKFAVHFLDHPELYSPTLFARQSAYCDLVARPRRDFIWPAQVSANLINRTDEIRNVAVSLAYRYSSTLRRAAPVLVISAEVFDGESWQNMESGCVCFSLEEFVELKG